jgi:DNA-directed RNA polymerase subunit RPC12/RpoP
VIGLDSTIMSIIIKLVLTGGLMFFLYKDARARDYSWLMWTLAPVLLLLTSSLGSSVLLLVLILAVYMTTRPKGGLSTCPHCSKKVHHILAFCPFCHQSVKKECLRCHDTVDWNAERCPHCGSMNLTKS